MRISKVGKQWYVLTGLFIILLLTNCVSMSTIQTARTTPKDDFGFGVGAGTVNSDIDIGADTVHFAFPFLEAYGRYGISDNLDVGLKFTLIGTIAGDVKYQFLGNQTSVLAGSIGAGLGYMSFSSGDSKSKVFDLIFPAYFSVHPAEIIGIYLNPKYVFRINHYTDSGSNGTSNSNWYGATGGIRFGKKAALFAEYSFFKNSKLSEPFGQITCGFAVGIQ